MLFFWEIPAQDNSQFLVGIVQELVNNGCNGEWDSEDQFIIGIMT